MATKLKLVKRTVVDSESDQIITMAQAGLSYNCIASQIYGTDKRGEPTTGSISRIGYILQREDIRVTDYRNARNSLGKAMISAIRRGANIIDSIRSSSQQVSRRLKVG